MDNSYKIYKLTCKCSKIYIGSTKDIVKRINTHHRTLLSPKSRAYNMFLYKHIRQCCTWVDIHINVIDSVYGNKNDKLKLEQDYQEKYDTLNTGLNIYNAIGGKNIYTEPLKDYRSEPFLEKIIEDYKNNPEQLNTDEIVNYYLNKKNVRNGNPISNGSKINQISVFKRELKKINNSQLLNHLKMPLDMMNDVNHHVRIVKIVIPSVIINNSDAVINQILDGLTSNLFDKLYPALLLASGRSPVEIYTLDYKKLSSTSIIIEYKKDFYKIPLLVNYKLFHSGIKKFRKLFPEVVDLSYSQISKKYTKINANALLLLSNRINHKISAVDLRGIYLQLLFKKSNTEQSFENWIIESKLDTNVSMYKFSLL
jgi:hypothetical protein